MNKPSSSTETVETNVGNKCREESWEQEPKKNFTNNALMHTTSSCFSLVVTALFSPSFYAFVKAPANHLERVVFMLNMLAIGLGHLLVTLHLHSGLTGHCLALCIIIGVLLGQLVIVRHSVSSLDCHCPIPITGVPTCCHSALCVIVEPSSSLLVGPFIIIRLQSRPTHLCWNITGPYSFSLDLIVVGLTYSLSLGPHSLMLASFA